MGDFRVVVEGVGNHGCGRETRDGGQVARCRQPHCTDCLTADFVNTLKARGHSVAKAELAHWPAPGAAGTTRTEKPGPVDDLLTGVRSGEF